MDAEEYLRIRVQVHGCMCGMAFVRLRDVDGLESGTVLTCEAGHEIIVDLWSPEDRDQFYRQAAVGRKVLKLFPPPAA